MYRVNRRLTYAVGDGRVTFTTHGRRGAGHPAGAGRAAAAARFRGPRGARVRWPTGSCSGSSGPVTCSSSRAAGRSGRSSSPTARSTGSAPASTVNDGAWTSWPTATTSATRRCSSRRTTGSSPSRPSTACTVLVLPQQAFEEVVGQSEALRGARRASSGPSPRRPQNKPGEAAIELAAGHAGEPELPGTFVDYETGAARVRAERRPDRAAGAHPGRGPLQPADEPDRAAAAADHRGAAGAPGARADQQPGVRAAAQRRPQAAHPHPHRPADPGRPGRAAQPARGSRGSSWPTRATIAAFGRECNRRGHLPAAPSRSTGSRCRPGAACRSCPATRSRSPRPAPARSS